VACSKTIRSATWRPRSPSKREKRAITILCLVRSSSNLLDMGATIGATGTPSAFYRFVANRTFAAERDWPVGPLTSSCRTVTLPLLSGRPLCTVARHRPLFFILAAFLRADRLSAHRGKNMRVKTRERLRYSPGVWPVSGERSSSCAAHRRTCLDGDLFQRQIGGGHQLPCPLDLHALDFGMNRSSHHRLESCLQGRTRDGHPPHHVGT